MQGSSLSRRRGFRIARLHKGCAHLLHRTSVEMDKAIPDENVAERSVVKDQRQEIGSNCADGTVFLCQSLG